MIRPLYFHLMTVLFVFFLGFLSVTGGSREQADLKSDWSELSIPELTAAEQDMNYLASSPRWDLDLELGEEENSKLNAADIRLVGIVEGEQSYALVSVQGEVGRFVVGSKIDEHEQWAVNSIKDDRVILLNGLKDSGEQIELLLYSQTDDE